MAKKFLKNMKQAKKDISKTATETALIVGGTLATGFLINMVKEKMGAPSGTMDYRKMVAPATVILGAAGKVFVAEPNVNALMNGVIACGSLYSVLDLFTKADGSNQFATKLGLKGLGEIAASMSDEDFDALRYQAEREVARQNEEMSGNFMRKSEADSGDDDDYDDENQVRGIFSQTADDEDEE